ncbi:MAG TPA: DUF5953 family protein, partial [Kofleriaceae bacterium]
AQPLAPDDPRSLRLLRAIEATWSIHLVCDLDDEGAPVRHDRDLPAYLASARRGGLPFLTTPDDEESATIGGLVEPAGFAAGGVEELHVLATLPIRPAPNLGEGLERVSSALGASWAMITPEAAHSVIVQQVVAPESDDAEPAGLPRLDPAECLGSYVPRRLGWISYWTDLTAANIGFAGDPRGFARVTRVETGWIVQLTDDPLDLQRADHMDALRAAYERHPTIGRAKRK